MASPDVERTIEAVWRMESARLIAGIARMVRDVGLAEDLVTGVCVFLSGCWHATGEAGP